MQAARKFGSPTELIWRPAPKEYFDLLKKYSAGQPTEEHYRSVISLEALNKDGIKPRPYARV
jgi:hypothetical protein